MDNSKWCILLGQVMAKLSRGVAVSSSEVDPLFRENASELTEILKAGVSATLEGYNRTRVRLSYCIQSLQLAQSVDDISALLYFAEDDSMCVFHSREEWETVCPEGQERLLALVGDRIWGPAEFENRAYQKLLIEARNALKRLNQFVEPLKKENW